jgi:DNA-binding transcriptional ArsR family regulator
MNEWLAAILPFIKDAKMSAILKEHVALLEAQRDDNIRLLDKTDAELASEKRKTAHLVQEVAALQVKFAALQPAKRHGETTEKILLNFFQREDIATPKEIAAAFELQLNTAKYHLDILEKNELIRWKPPAPFKTVQPGGMEITDLGRAYIIENNVEAPPTRDSTYT